MSNTITITRRLSDAYNDLSTEFKALYCDRDFHKVLNDMRASSGGYWHQNTSILLKMLEHCGLECEPGKEFDTNHYEFIVNKFVTEGRIMTKEQLGEKLMSICKRLAEDYMKYPAPRDYMQRLVNLLCKKEDTDWQGDSLRLRILKQFIKYGNYAAPFYDEPRVRDSSKIETYVRTKLNLKPRAKLTVDEVLQNLDDNIFVNVKNCKLLRTCEALAGGHFLHHDATKTYLYLFAMVYEMTYFTYKSPTAVKDDSRDIEKRLFRDYYSTNLIQYLVRKDASKNQTSQDIVWQNNQVIMDPDNCMINYKNFTEVVYLYCICKNITPAEKITLACRLINELRITEQNTSVPGLSSHRGSNTVYMQELVKGTEGTVYAEDIMAYPENEFKEFIRKHYDCCVGVDGNRVSPIKVQAVGQTAASAFKSIANKLTNKYPDRKNIRYGLFFDEVRETSDDQTENNPINESDDNFTVILRAADRLIRDWIPNDTRSKKENPKKENQVNRTKLLAAFYYAYNDEHVNDGDESDDLTSSYGRSFRSHFEQFQDEVNKLFAPANFAPFSHRNLLDMLVVCSSYIYIYA